MAWMPPAAMDRWKLIYRSIFTFFGIFLETAALWAYRKENTTERSYEDKVHIETRPPLDAPTVPAVPAGTV